MGLWPAGRLAAEFKITRVDIGAGIPFTYNAAWAQTTGTDLRLGAGLAGSADGELSGIPFHVMLTLSKSQLLRQRIDGEKNENICSENYFPALASGPCSMWQARLAAMYTWHHVGFGLSVAYSYFSNFTYRSSAGAQPAEIYNSKRSYEAVGPVISYRLLLGRFSLIAAAHFDYALFTQSPLAIPDAQSLQIGATIYAMAKIL